MAKLTLTIIRGTDDKGTDLGSISITTGAERVGGEITYNTIYWERDLLDENPTWVQSKTADEVTFKLNMGSIRFDKKMYSPNEIIADIQFSVVCPTDGHERKAFIDRDALIAIFANKQVMLVCDDIEVCNDYYVHDIIPRRYKDEMYVTLQIYSPDKLLTLEPYCRTFVAKKLSAILNTELKNYTLPYNATTTVTKNCTDMKFLQKESKEHIFPYLVQYNESFYDFLARTANRWGEFMYYEDGELTFGYKTPSPLGQLTSIDGYSLLTWHDLTEKQPEQSNAGTYAGEAPYDNNILNSVITKNKYDSVKNTIFNDSENGADIYWLGKVGQFLTNDKSLLNFLVDGTIDDIVAYGQVQNRVDKNNGKINDTYFKTSDNYVSDQFGKDGNEVKTLNLFSEIDPIVNANIYSTILQGELAAGKNAIKVEYDTAFPQIKLGMDITVDGKHYIVVQIEGYQPEVILKGDNNYYEHAYNTSEVRYRITAIAADSSQTLPVFYPMVIPAGHVRKSGAQVAVVVDVNDPLRANRVRVKYPWQLSKQYESITAKDLKGMSMSDATPWLFYASPSGPASAGVHGRHYLAEKVLVDFAGGNVERPFVVGAVSKEIPNALKTGSATLAAPNGELVNVHEGTGKGVSSFLTGMNPGFKMLRGFGVFNFGEDWKHSESFEGGVDIGDRYGIWSIKGSTHDRNISIKSPWGDVKIDAFTGITINAPNGDVKIKGKNISLEAGNNLTLISGKNIKNQLLPSVDRGAGTWFSELGQQVAAAVTTKLVSMGVSAFDLSLLRNVFEVFLRPDEGLLKVKSNRFLKLESGKGSANYPDTAYANKSKMVAAAKKARTGATNTIFFETNLLPDVLKLFDQINTYIEGFSRDLLAEFNSACQKKHALDQKWSQLRTVTAVVDGNRKPIENYDNLIADTWNQDVTADFALLAENDIPFTDQVKIEGVEPDVQASRQAKRNAFRDQLNELRQKVYEVKKLANKKIEGDAAGDLLDVKAYGFAKDTIDKLKATVHQDVLKKIGEFTDEEKKLNDDKTLNTFHVRERHIVARKMALALLDELGFNDTVRVNVNNVLPPKPASDDDLVGLEWDNYVDSIKKLPKLATDDSLFVKKNVAALTQAWSNFAVWRPFTEWFAWGDNAKGEILFSSGKGTYMLGNHIEPRLGGHASGILDEDELSEQNRTKLTSLRGKLKAL
jgi:hypothetical protein